MILFLRWRFDLWNNFGENVASTPPRFGPYASECDGFGGDGQFGREIPNAGKHTDYSSSMQIFAGSMPNFIENIIRNG